MQDVEISVLLMVAGQDLRDRLRNVVTWKELRDSAPSHQKEQLKWGICFLDVPLERMMQNALTMATRKKINFDGNGSRKVVFVILEMFRPLLHHYEANKKSHEWGYGPNNGPDTWAEDHPVANGKRQSPINIVPRDGVFDCSLKQLKLLYDPSDAIGILNNGHSFQVDFLDDTDSSTLSGGPVTGVYRLRQFHCHWGSSNDRGSEHTVNGISFPCELHLVHWNTKYPSFGAAAKEPDGLAVVGVFLRIGAANSKLQKILDYFSSIKNKGMQTSLSSFDTQTLLPPSLEYWTYEGSLTTPPLLESVTWIVLKQAITVSRAQMEIFRSLQFSSEGDGQSVMADNFRPPQPLRGRQLRANFKL